MHSQRSVLKLVLALCFSSAVSATRVAAADSAEMRPIELNGYSIFDAEYLPFLGEQTLHYPGDVLWGFYPAGATDAAKQCALTAYRTLLNFFEADCDDLRATIAAGATSRFGLWINDYSKSSRRASYRPGHFWHRGLSAHDFTQGLWTWEVTVTPDLECIGPSEAQVTAALAAARSALTVKQ